MTSRSSDSTSKPNRRLCIAPMMDWTDKHERYFLRLITRHALLYTEMVTTGALLEGKRYDLLDFNPEEHPVALQLGGSDPTALAACARLGEERGYDEINLNVGCPSDRVQNGAFGACLMAQPALVRDCLQAMQDAVDIPITIKHRIGIDDQDSYEELTAFIDQVSASDCKTFIIHARKAILSGLSPKQNREIPPLKYPFVYQLKKDFPDLEIIINGGITELQACQEHLINVDGVMIGREAYQNPYFLNDADHLLFGEPLSALDRSAILEAFMPYMEQEIAQGTAIKHMVKHILGLYKGVPGGKQFRRHLSERAFKPEAGIDVVEEALAFVA